MKEFRTHCYGCTSMYLRAVACLVSEVTQARETRGSQDGEWQSSLTEPTYGNPKKGFIDLHPHGCEDCSLPSQVCGTAQLRATTVNRS